MFKVLVIAYYFPPKGLSGVQRILKFVKYLPKNNWMPTVLTSEVNAYYAYDETLLKELENDAIKIVRVGGRDINSVIPKKGTVKMPPEWMRKTFSYLSAFFFLPDNKKSWSEKAYEKGKELLKNESYDLIFVTGPPFSAFMAGAKLSDETGVPLALDYRDLWFGSYFAIYPTFIHRYFLRRIEYRCLKSASKVFVINRSIKEKIMQYFSFVQHNEISIVTHGYDPEDFTEAIPHPKAHNRMILTHSGLLYEYVTPYYLLHAFKRLLIERPDIANGIELMFVGLLRKSLTRLVKKLGLEAHVNITGYVSHTEAVSKVMMSDVLWVMVGKARNSDAHTPSKFFEYVGTRKPVFGMVVDGSLKNMIEEYKAGYICDPYNIDAIKNTLIKMYEDYRTNKFPQANEEVVERYRRDNLTEMLAKEFQFVVRVR